MKHHGLSMCRIAQKMPAEYRINIMEFQKRVITARKKSCFELRQIGSMVEVPLNRIVDTKGAKSVTVNTFCHTVC
jgi:hypothetical protein